LKKFFRVAEEFVGLRRTHAQSSRGQLCSKRGFGDRGICGDKADFIHMDVRVTLKGRFQLLR
jgi:hypothetical protein